MPNSATKTNLSIILGGLEASTEVLEVLFTLHANFLTANDSFGGSATAAENVRIYTAPDPNKCVLLHIILRATEARFVVEAGSSFGTRTIYLALAVTQNVAKHNADASKKVVDGGVLATEADPLKVAVARRPWNAAGEEIEGVIELREGDVRETLKTGLPEHVDFLLLDT